MTKPKLVAIVGTTASGKSSLAIDLAKMFNAEVVSADSRQIYKGLDLGTGKVTPEEIAGVPHHMLDIIEPNTPYSLAEYQKATYAVIDDIIARGKLPILVGGTGLYTRAIIEGYDLDSAEPDFALRESLEGKSADELVKILIDLGVTEISEPENPRRLIRQIEKAKSGKTTKPQNKPRYDVLQIGITFDRDILYKRIEERLDMRLNDGMVEEIKGLLDAGATPEFMEGLGLEYRYTTRYILGKYSSFEEYRAELLKEIRHFAKRQMTWFRKEKDIYWVNEKGDYLNESKKLIENFIKK